MHIVCKGMRRHRRHHDWDLLVHLLAHLLASSSCSLSHAFSLSLLANSSTVASARTEAVAASPQPLWHKSGAVQESVAAVLAKLEAGIVSGVVQVPFFLCVALSAVRAPE